MTLKLSRDVEHDGILYEKGTQYVEKDHKDFKKFFQTGKETEEEAKATVVKKPEGQVDPFADKSKKIILEEIRAYLDEKGTPMTEDELKRADRLNRDDLIALHKETVVATPDAEKEEEDENDGNDQSENQ